LETKDEIAKYFYCSPLFEEKVAKAYHKVSERVFDKEVVYLQEYITKDSFKHAAAFRALTTYLTQQTYCEDCEKIKGETWVKVIREAKRYRQTKARLS